MVPFGYRLAGGPTGTEQRLRLSSKGDYGVRALVDLAQNQGQGPIPGAVIAARQGIPVSLIGQVMASLRTAGFVRSVRGAQGGHELARDPAALRLDVVVQSVDGAVSPSDCLDDPDTCDRSAFCAQRRMWEDVRRAILDVLAGRTIADLAREEAAATGGRYYI